MITKSGARRVHKRGSPLGANPAFPIQSLFLLRDTLQLEVFQREILKEFDRRSRGHLNRGLRKSLRLGSGSPLFLPY